MESRIYDYQKFSSDNPRKNNRGEYSFSHKIGITDIFFVNKPEELGEISDASAVIDYIADVVATKGGIEDIKFKAYRIELVVEKDSYPEESEEIDIDIEEGGNIQMGRIRSVSNECPIPSYPTRLEIDMKNSMNVSNFLIEVVFGKDI